MQGSKTVGFMLRMFVVAGFFSAGLAQGQTLQRVDAGGGSVSPPVANGNYLYAGTGATLSTWDMSDPVHPVYAGRSSAAPERGPIGGVAVVGGYLYVSWYTTADDGGITVFSLADPAHPQAVAELDDYIASNFKRPQALVAAGNHVYVGDADNGLVVLDATDPLHPLLVGQSYDVNTFDTMAVFGDKLLTSGRGFIGGLVSVVDISDPAAPVVEGTVGLDVMFLRAALTDGYAIAVGFDLGIFDLSDPANITQVFDTSIDPATQALVHGDMLYLIGATGLQVWDFSTPSAPVLLRTVDLGAHTTFDPMQATDTPFGPIVFAKSSDLGFVFDASDAQNPTLASTFNVPFGIATHAAAFDATHAYFAQEDYGFSALDASTLDTVGSFHADLDDSGQARDFEDIAVDGTRAYAAAWGYGVIITNIIDPAHPVEIGRFEFPFASAIEAHGNRVYVSSTTNGGIFAVYDVADAANPQLLGQIQTSQTFDLTVRGDYAYLVDGSAFGDGGLRIVDVSHPEALAVVGQDATDCTYASGVDVSADGNTVYIACSNDANFNNALQIIDATDKSAPVLAGSIALPGVNSGSDYNDAHSVVVNSGMAYVGNENGLDEIDVSTPSAPTWLTRHDTGYAVFKVENAPDGRIFAFSQVAGTWVFAPVDHIFSDGFDG